jgi:hypothetical protein
MRHGFAVLAVSGLQGVFLSMMIDIDHKYVFDVSSSHKQLLGV